MATSSSPIAERKSPQASSRTGGAGGARKRPFSFYAADASFFHISSASMSLAVHTYDVMPAAIAGV